MKTKQPIPKYNKVKDYIKWLYESCLTDIFLKRVQYVYGCKSRKEAMSLVWSNNLVGVINFMAQFYFDKKNKDRERRIKLKEEMQERSLSNNEKIVYRNLDKNERINKMRKDTPCKYKEKLLKENEHNKKIFYSKKELDDELCKFCKKLDYMDFKVININPIDITPELIKKEMKNKKTKRILIIQENLK